MANQGQIYYGIQLDTAQLKRDVEEVRKSFGKIGDAAESESKKLDNVFAKISSEVPEKIGASLRALSDDVFGNLPKRAQELAKEIKEELGVITPDLNTPVSRLSGGNVQKVLVGREIASHPKLLMTAYATRGLDINTSYEIYRKLDEEKKKGAAVIYVGEDLDVLLAISDRILVLSDGKMMGILDARKTDKKTLGLLMAGKEAQ